MECDPHGMLEVIAIACYACKLNKAYIFIRGEYWNASAEDEIASGESVEVPSVEGLRLRVRRAGASR